MPLIHNAFQVLTSAGILWPTAAGPPGGQKRVSIYNNGPNAIYIGGQNIAVTVATGFKIPSGGSFVLSPGTINGPIIAIAETANQVSPADTRVVVEVAD
jgi:hypothetical protein